MRISKVMLAVALTGSLAGCLQTDSERGVAGAAAGALIADATDNNVIAGAAIGGLAGAFCDDAGICRGY